MILLSFIIKVSLIFDTSFMAFSKFSFLLPIFEPSERYTSFHFLVISTATSLSGSPTGAQGFLISNFTSFIKEKAVQNQKSSSPEKQAFGGYAAISLKDYMKEGALRLRLRLSESDKLKLEDIDFSRLSDGHYMINNDYFIVNNGMYTIVEDEGDFENFLLRESSKQFYLEDFYKIEKLD